MTKVKRFESGIVKDPITITQDMTVKDVLALTQQYRISGLPVVEADGKVVGIVTNRDLRFERKLNQPVRKIMTPREKLITVREGASREEARALMHKHRLERVLVVNDAPAANVRPAAWAPAASSNCSKRYAMAKARSPIWTSSNCSAKK